jgi:hypothetical protein
MARHGLNATAKRMLSAYAEEDEQWKPDHNDAMACRDLEDTLRCGNGLYDSICKIAEHRWLEAQDPDDFREIEEYFTWWLKPCDRIMAKIAELEREFKDGVEGANQFRRNCEQAKEEFLPKIRYEARVASVEARVGFRDVELTPQAADMLNRILSDPSEGPRPAYEPKSVPLADPSILRRGR